MAKKLYRSSKNKKLAGVCGGMAEYFDMDTTIIRLIWAFLTVLSGGTGLILYVIAAFIIPESESAKLEDIEKDEADIDADDSESGNNSDNEEEINLEDK